MRKFRVNQQGQAMMEFTFCMIVILVMMYSMMMIFRWTGLDLAERRFAHENALYTPFNHNTPGNTPARQLHAYFYKPIKMNAVTDTF